jgi:hypothetical protein
MKQLLIFPILYLACLLQGFAQAKVAVNSPFGVNQMVERYTEIQKTTPTVKGWRIQLLATTDRQEMESTLYRFQGLYPYIKVDWEHVQPYYKIRAGAFQSKLEAYRILYLIKRDYPGAYPIIDPAIRPAEFLN